MMREGREDGGQMNEEAGGQQLNMQRKIMQRYGRRVDEVLEVFKNAWHNENRWREEQAKMWKMRTSCELILWSAGHRRIRAVL